VSRRPLTAAWAEAPAKVNLGLAVTGRRADGYHDLRSVFLRLALHDHLEVTRAADPAGPDELVIEGQTGLPIEDNLVLRAVASLRTTSGGRPPDRHRPSGPVGGELPALAFRLDKHIPSAAGLGGGSSDAAAALRLASQSWGLLLEAGTLHGIGRRMGADVPFFLSGHTAALVAGIGEIVEALPGPRTAAGLLLATPLERLSTAAVFAELDRLPAAPGHPVMGAPEATIAALAETLRFGFDGPLLVDLAARLRDANDLWPAAARLSSGLDATRAALEERLERPVLLSGSGPTLFAVYASSQAAADAAAELVQDRPAALQSVLVQATSSSTSGGSS
jgi:4-diphosphocytidyl-2-C-methyl-D-erythritol kinase